MNTFTTDVLIDKDYFEWHGGVRHYGFWCVRINDGSWLDHLSHVTHIFAPYLQTDYLRFPHVTIATVGLMDDRSWQVVERQKNLLKSLSCSKLDLIWEEISSYQHSPIIKVASQENALHKIRDNLHTISHGDDLDLFDPHITLGYYAKEFSLKDNLLGKKSDAKSIKNIEIRELLFCTYETYTIKGPISIEFTMNLE